MATKKKGNYSCKTKVECLSCGSVVMAENQKLHIGNKHNGDQSVKLKIKNDAKQPRLDMFTLHKKDFNQNEPCSSSTLVSEQAADDPMAIERYLKI